MPLAPSCHDKYQMLLPHPITAQKLEKLSSLKNQNQWLMYFFIKEVMSIIIFCFAVEGWYRHLFDIWHPVTGASFDFPVTVMGLGDPYHPYFYVWEAWDTAVELQRCASLKVAWPMLQGASFACPGTNANYSSPWQESWRWKDGTSASLNFSFSS